MKKHRLDPGWPITDLQNPTRIKLSAQYAEIVSKIDNRWEVGPIAKGKKTGGKDFKKGQSGNPNGRPAVPEDVKAARKLCKSEFSRIMERCLWMSLSDFANELKRDDLTMFEKACMQMIQHAAAGCEKRFELILNRFIGRPRDKMEITVPEPFIVKLVDGSAAYKVGSKAHEDDQ